MGTYEFVWDERLGIRLPDFNQPFEEFTYHEQSEIVEKWEAIRGRIPSRVFELEHVIDSTFAPKKSPTFLGAVKKVQPI